MSRRILVTSALPNANGPIHLGHVLEQIQTDIWVRFQRMRGHQAIYVCADDTHGTATMIKAEQEGVTAETLVENMRQLHVADSQGFLIDHDNYYSTHSPENQHYSELIYTRLQEAGLIFTEQVEQLYDPEKGLFLADRFVVGGCPRCKAPDQYGDNCEACGATYNANELIEPKSISPVPRRNCAAPIITSLIWPATRIFLRTGLAVTRYRPKSPTSLRSGWTTDSAPGTFPVTPRISASPFRAPLTSTSTSGWTLPSATWPASRICVISAMT